MWTLTFAEAHHDRDEVCREVAAWIKRLRDHLGEAFPYVYVLELHPGGHGWHVHVLMQRKFVRHEVMARLWGHGFVQFSDENRRLKLVKGGRARARAAASYLSKYVGKDVGRNIGAGRHAYEVGEGFAPARVVREWSTFADGWRSLLLDHHGELPEVSWSSEAVLDWCGPPCRWFLWE